jgi:hypothetical protein
VSRPDAPPAAASSVTTGSARLTLSVLVGIAAALAAAYVVPPLAIVVVWPLLFVVPGWALVTVARPRIDAVGRLGLAIVLSVAISAHLVYWLSMVIGYRRETIFVATWLLALPAAFVVARGSPRYGRAVTWPLAWRVLVRHRFALGFAAFSAMFVAAVLAGGLWHVTPDGVDSGGSNWSDLSVHLSIAQSLNAANFPPQVPYFSGEPLIYHWFADFHAAVAARAAGLFAIPVFIVSSAILAGALALVVQSLARVLLRGPGARRAALIAGALVVFAGGLGWIRYVGDIVSGYGDPVTLVTHNSYDNAWYDAIGNPVVWPYFRIPSVMGTGLLVHRATTAGLPMLVAVVLLLVAGLPSAHQRRAGLQDRPALIGLAGLLGALLAPFHFFFFPVGLGLGFLWALTGGRLWDRATLPNAALFLSPYLLSLPFSWPALTQAAGSGALRQVIGWESAPMADGPWAVAFFYITNLGLPVILAAVALFWRGLPHRWFLGAWAAALFLIPNLVQVSVIGFDMNKYFQAMAIALAILAAWLMRRWRPAALAAVFGLAVPSVLLVSAWTAFNREQVLSSDQLAATAWITANTPADAVFATDGWLNSPTDPAGRRRLTTFGPYVANLGYDTDRRAAQVAAIFCGASAQASATTMRQLGATYLLEDGLPTGCQTPIDFGASPAFRRVYANPSVTIFRLTNGAPVSSAP